jgi:hypothetical protein
MKKLTTILLISITLLSALEKPTPLVLEVVKKRDVLQENRDMVKEMALNQCSATRGRTFSYFYHDDSYHTN